MKKIKKVILLLFFPLSAVAQSIHVGYTDGGSNDDTFRALRSDGQQVVALGDTRRYDNGNTQRRGVFAARLDSLLGKTWGEVVFDSPDNDWARDIAVSLTGDTILLIFSDGYLDGQHEARFFNFSGNQAGQTFVLTGADLTAMEADSLGFLVVGHTTDQFDQDALIARYMPWDTTIVVDTIQLPGQQHLYDLVLVNDSLAIAAGSTDGASATSSGMFLVGFDPVTLDTLWTRLVQVGNAEVAYGVTVTDSGRIFVCGRGNVGTNNRDVVLLEINSSGQVLQSVVWGSPQGDEAAYDIKSSDTVLAVIGVSEDINGQSDVWLSEWGLDLVMICDTSFGDTGKDDVAWAIAGDHTGTWQIVGTIAGGINKSPQEPDGFVVWFSCTPPPVPTGAEGRRVIPNLNIYPNPFSDWVTVQAISPQSWSLSAMTGQQLADGRLLPGENKLFFPGLAPGVYLLRVGGQITILVHQ